MYSIADDLSSEQPAYLGVAVDCSRNSKNEEIDKIIDPKNQNVITGVKATSKNSSEQNPHRFRINYLCPISSHSLTLAKLEFNQRTDWSSLKNSSEQTTMCDGVAEVNNLGMHPLASRLFGAGRLQLALHSCACVCLQLPSNYVATEGGPHDYVVKNASLQHTHIVKDIPACKLGTQEKCHANTTTHTYLQFAEIGQSCNRNHPFASMGKRMQNLYLSCPMFCTRCQSWRFCIWTIG